MAQIKIVGLSKSYGNKKALNNISFEVMDKEFVVVFGPAGAGKTTLLSAISGILDYEEGSIIFNQSAVDALSPDKRNVAMVFENYALYPHFTVYDNIAFPLRSPQRKTDEKTIRSAVHAVTQKMNIDHLLERMPYQLSNGQRQRVALGRALVRSPHVFLMDEPLAHLDAKLKNKMRTELKEIQQHFDTTTIYVTHDYLEALSLADKIVVMHEGAILQVGTPDDVYYRPANTFVAKFVGEPEINLYECRLTAQGVSFVSSDFSIPVDAKTKAALNLFIADDVCTVGIRGVDVDVSFSPNKSASGHAYQSGVIRDFYSIGNRFVVTIGCGNFSINALVSGDYVPEIGKGIYFYLRMELLFFDARTGSYITRTGGVS